MLPAAVLRPRYNRDGCSCALTTDVVVVPLELGLLLAAVATVCRSNMLASTLDLVRELAVAISNNGLGLKLGTGALAVEAANAARGEVTMGGRLSAT